MSRLIRSTIVAGLIISFSTTCNLSLAVKDFRIIIIYTIMSNFRREVTQQANDYLVVVFTSRMARSRSVFL
jgi:hypothetical protein